jgi:hypothetical protein
MLLRAASREDSRVFALNDDGLFIMSRDASGGLGGTYVLSASSLLVYQACTDEHNVNVAGRRISKLERKSLRH